MRLDDDAICVTVSLRLGPPSAVHIHANTMGQRRTSMAYMGIVAGKVKVNFTITHKAGGNTQATQAIA